MFKIGTTHGNWEVISEPQKLNGKTFFICLCICGKESKVRSEVLKNAQSKYCRSCMYQVIEIKPGDMFGDWKVIEEVKTEEKRKTYIVQCKCGIIKTQKAIRLRFGDSTCCRKCGSSKHGMCDSGTYITWECMVQRVTNKNHSNYKWYGGRGIKICDRWMIFENFIEDMGERPDGKTIDRIDNNGNYEKSNCRWVTPKENNNNRSNKRK